MGFRSLDLNKYHLDRISFAKPLSEEVLKRCLAVVEDEEVEDEHFHGHHPYTISGTRYWSYLHLFPRADADEESEQPFGFEVVFYSGEPDDGVGPKLIRRVATKLITTAGEADSDGIFLTTANFSFPTEEYASPLIPRSPPFDFEEETPELPEEYQLRPSGVRYTAEKRYFDVIVDTAPGPVTVRIQRGVEGVLSLDSIQETIKDFSELAELFVEPQRKTGDAEDQE